MIKEINESKTLDRRNTTQDINETTIVVTVRLKSTAWKMAKYGVFSGPYFHVFSPNTEKDRPE